MPIRTRSRITRVHPRFLGSVCGMSITAQEQDRMALRLAEIRPFLDERAWRLLLRGGGTRDRLRRDETGGRGGEGQGGHRLAGGARVGVWGGPGRAGAGCGRRSPGRGGGRPGLGAGVGGTGGFGDPRPRRFSRSSARYCLDGLLGLVIGSGYLDLGIVIYGVQSLPLGFEYPSPISPTSRSAASLRSAASSWPSGPGRADACTA